MPTDTTITNTFGSSVLSIQSGEKTLSASFLDFAETVDVGTFQRTSIFEGHLLEPINTEALPIPTQYGAWFFALLFFGFVLFAWLMSFNLKRVGQVFGSLFSNRGFARLTKDGDIFSEQLFFPFAVLVLLSFPLLVFRVGMMWGFWNMLSHETIAVYIQVTLGVGMLYLLKVVIIKISAWIFKEQAVAKHYLLNLFVFNTCLALCFLPLLLVAFFGETWLQTGVVYAMIFLFAGWFIWRAVRSFFVTISLTKFSYVHNFLYLCTLEIGYYMLVYAVSRQIFNL